MRTTNFTPIFTGYLIVNLQMSTAVYNTCKSLKIIKSNILMPRLTYIVEITVYFIYDIPMSIYLKWKT